MRFYAVVIFVAFAVVGVPAPPGHEGHVSHFCRSCNKVLDPNLCTTVERCDPESSCGTEVHVENGVDVFTMGCRAHHRCELHMVILGKRAHHHPDVQNICQECCNTADQCNKDLCAKFAPTSAPTTPANGCMDHEEDGVLCSHYEQFNFCTDVGGVAFQIAHEKCPKHCGFCDANGWKVTKPVFATDAPMTAAPMTDAPMTAAPMTDAPMTNAPMTAAPMTDAPMTAAPMTDAPMTDAPVMSATPMGASVMVSSGTTAEPCMDYEDSSFSCADWAAHGFCTATTGQGHEIAKLRCRQYCGYCS